MKKIVLALTTLLLLTGCEDPKPKGVFKDVVVKDKKIKQDCGARSCWDAYYVTFEKNGTVVTLEVDTDNKYNLLTKGSVVTVSYDDIYRVMDISFPTLEKSK